MSSGREPQPVALYIHFPFCLRKCHYCDFNSLAGSDIAPTTYIECLIREMALRRRQLPDIPSAATLYFGGGTPSLMEPTLIAHIIEQAKGLFGLTRDAEITIEANPGTLTPAKLAGYLKAGVNRLSLGVQSFSDAHLTTLGRVHTAQQALDSFADARAAGFNNVSIDLIHSLPGETPAEWRVHLQQAVDLGPHHISAYGLSIEEGTTFHALESAGKLHLPDEEEGVAMFLQTREVLCDAGFEHYEISSFARPGYRSRHNQIYWQRKDYLGFGAGAHSFLKSPGYGRRWLNSPAPNAYCTSLADSLIPEEDITLLTVKDAMGEFFFLGLRQLEGISPADFALEFGRSVDEAFPGAVTELEAEGLLETASGKVRLTEKGLLVANQVMVKFV